MQIPCVYFNALIQVSDSEEECVNLSNGNVIGLIVRHKSGGKKKNNCLFLSLCMSGALCCKLPIMPVV